jgi:hypothetical protein
MSLLSEGINNSLVENLLIPENESEMAQMENNHNQTESLNEQTSTIVSPEEECLGFDELMQRYSPVVSL